MRAGIHFLIKMPYKYQVLFLKRYTESGRSKTISSMLQDTYDSHIDFISGVFTWSKTPEGHDYWRNVSLCIY